MMTGTDRMSAAYERSRCRPRSEVASDFSIGALGDLMERLSERYDDNELRHDIDELRAAVGLEDRETTSKR